MKTTKQRRYMLTLTTQLPIRLRLCTLTLLAILFNTSNINAQYFHHIYGSASPVAPEYCSSGSKILSLNPNTIPPLEGNIMVGTRDDGTNTNVYYVYTDVNGGVITNVEIKLTVGGTTTLDAANGYMFFYTDIAALSGSYNYNLSLNYKDVWLGKVSNETNIKLARKNTGIPWIAFISSLSNVDTIKNTIAANAINDVACFTGTDNSNPLPVNLLDISAYKMRSNTIVNWTTAQEINTRVFEIEKSLEIGHWLLVGKVKAAENSNSIKNYQFTDALAAFGMKKTIYYRLKIIDNDGSFTYSKIVSVNLFDELKEGLIEAYPNPFSENILLKINSTQNQEVKVILRDLSGRTILNESFEVNSGLTLRSPTIVTELQSGFYFLTVEMGENIQTLKLIKQ